MSRLALLICAGRSPFEGGNKDEIKAAILNFQMRTLPSFLTPGCQDFILKCLCPKASDRPSALALLSHPWVQLHCTPADLVTIARLPIQLPKVPMGYRQPSSSSTSASTAAQHAHAHVPVQEASTGTVSTCSSTTVTAPASPALTPREAVAAPCSKPSPRFMQGPETKIHANSSTTSSPDSPQIPAFMPSAGPGSPAGMVCSNASVVSTACSHMDNGRSCSSSRSSNCSSIMHGPGGLAAHGPPSIGHTASTESMRSNGGVYTNDSVASLYQHSLAVAAAAGVNSSGWVSVSAAAPASAPGWQQEPIQESPTDESAAAAASLAGHSGRSENASGHSFSSPQQQQLAVQQQYVQQQQKQLTQQPPTASSLQQPQQDMQQALLDHIATSKLLAAQQAATAANAGGMPDKGRKSPSGGKRLWKWMCVAAGAASKS